MVKFSKRTLAYIYLLINVITWGAALPIVKLGLSDTSPFRYLLYRYIFAVLFSLPILFHYLPKIKNLWTTIGKVVLIELLGTTIGLSFLYIGLNNTSAIEASLIATTTPIFITLCGIWFLREREETHEWIGLLIAFIGTLLMTFLPQALSHQNIFDGNFMGNILVFANNIIAALYFILAKKHFSKLPKLFVTTISFYVGLITFGIFSLIETGGSIQKLVTLSRMDLSHPSVWFIALYMAIFGSIIGLTAYIKGQDVIETSEAGMFGYLQPAVYIPLGFLLLREKISWIQILSLLLVIFGVYIAERRTRRKNRI